ncbi:MAG: FISUMP domain-containing protein [Candidatus Falkowbacteria bacterium]
MSSLVKYIFIVFIFLLFAHRGEAAVFSHNLSQGSRDPEVKALQQYLNTHGYPVAKIGAGSRGKETTVFGPATKQALIRFQKDNHITPANGYFGPTTRKVMTKERSVAGATPTPKNTPTTSLLKPNPLTPSVIIESPKSNTPEITPVNTYTIGGTIMGLTGAVTLRNNTTDQLMLTPASASLFTFPASLPTGASYSVTATPGSMTEHCYLINNSGTVASTNITTIQIACGTTLADTIPANPFTNPIIPSSAPTIHQLTYTTDGYGTITGSSTQRIAFNTNGTEVTATPNTGYHFTAWNDGLTNPTRIDTNIRNNQTYTANFAINTYTLTYTVGANGTLSGATTQTVTHGSAGTEVIAIPNAYYMFSGWSDGVLTATRTDGNVTSTQILTANFIVTPFTACGQTLYDERDGNTYPTVQIGAQCWTAKNMAYLPNVVPSATGATNTPYYYVHSYQGSNVTAAKATANYSIYGVLYNHPAALTACPTGWHLATDNEYIDMTTPLGTSVDAANKLKATSTWGGSNGLNTMGFSILAAGYRFHNGLFYELGTASLLRTDGINYNPADGIYRAYDRYVSWQIVRTNGWVDDGMSVRCLKN